MLSKWLLISVLALGIQNICASNYLGNYIDLTKFSKVFYDPNTRMTLKGALENIGRDPFGLPRIGFNGAKCNCEGFTCGCCSDINITRFNFNHHVCTNFTYYPDDFAIKFKLLLDEKEILTSGSISAKNPAPICVPFYPPFISFCVRFFDINTLGNNLHSCIDFETQVLGWPILILHFDCVKIGEDGISWIKPEENNNVLLIMPEVNGPEIYDQVDFEPDSVFPNNHTSNMTPAEEDNIGQLKL